MMMMLLMQNWYDDDIDNDDDDEDGGVSTEPFQYCGHFRPKHKDAKFFVNHLNPVMFVII